MRKLVWMGLALLLAACGTTSYGAAKDGVFPTRPGGSDYPNWEHMCVVVTQSSTTETLNNSGSQGWEFVALGMQGTNHLMCFKRPIEVATAK